MAERSGLEEVTAANLDISERFKTESVTVSYDQEFDIFILRLGEPHPAITEEVRDGLSLRVDPLTLRFLAFEIVGFKRRFLKAHPELIDMYRLLFEDDSPVVKRDIPSQSQQRRRAQNVAAALVAGLTVTSPRPA